MFNLETLCNHPNAGYVNMHAAWFLWCYLKWLIFCIQNKDSRWVCLFPATTKHRKFCLDRERFSFYVRTGKRRRAIRIQKTMKKINEFNCKCQLAAPVSCFRKSANRCCTWYLHLWINRALFWMHQSKQLQVALVGWKEQGWKPCFCLCLLIGPNSTNKNKWTSVWGSRAKRVYESCSLHLYADTLIKQITH